MNNVLTMKKKRLGHHLVTLIEYLLFLYMIEVVSHGLYSCMFFVVEIKEPIKCITICVTTIQLLFLHVWS